jgi:hypothetical protein
VPQSGRGTHGRRMRTYCLHLIILGMGVADRSYMTAETYRKP